MGGAFKPARDMLSRGKTELLLGMGIVKKLDLAVNFENNQFKFGQCEWEMMTFNEKHRWAFPLVPTACGYAKLNEYFGKLRDVKIEVLQLQGDFGGDLSVRKVSRPNRQRVKSTMGISKSVISEMGNGPKYDFPSCGYYCGFSVGVG